MVARNSKQPRSQVEPLSTAEIFNLYSLIERAKAKRQLDEILMQFQIQASETTTSSPTSTVADFMLVDKPNEPSAAAGAKQDGPSRAKPPPMLPNPELLKAIKTPTMTQPSTTSSTSSNRMNVTQFIMPRMHVGRLPSGVSSIEQWSKTLCELPKLRDRRWSYGRICQEAWNDKELSTYLKWVVNKFGNEEPKAGKASDLAGFFKAVAYPMEERLQSFSEQRPLAPVDGQLD